MGAVGPWEITFWYASLLAKAGLLGRLVWLRLAREYPAISAFLALQLARTLWLMQYSTASNEYSYGWLFTEPLLILSRALVMFELYEKILAGYRGLSFLSRGTMAAVLTASLTLAFAAHYPAFTSHRDFSKWMNLVFLFETTAYSGMLVFIVALVAFMLWFPAQVKKNVLVHCCAFSAYFVVSSASVYLRQIDVAEWGRLSSSWRMLAADIIMALWILLITKRGEQEATGIALRFAPDSRERLLKQLDDLNRALESRRRQTPAG